MNHEANGTGNMAGRFAASRRIIGELGPAGTYAAQTDRMAAEGFKPVTEETFDKHRREVFPHAPPATLPDDRPLDALERLVKATAFAMSVGGIGEARRMLDALERVQGEFGGPK